MNRDRSILLLLIIFGLLAVVSTVFAISSTLAYQSSLASHENVGDWFLSPSLASHTGYLISIPVSIGSWIGFGVTFALWRGGSLGRSSIWQKSGLDKNVYDLIVKMRGGNSRLELLRNLETPKQRNELTQITGIDWKEVDRNIGLLLSYGLVSIYAESGSVKIYKLTEQGRLLLKLIDEMNR